MHALKSSAFGEGARPCPTLERGRPARSSPILPFPRGGRAGWGGRDARAPRRRRGEAPLPFTQKLRHAHASRSAKSLLQLARQGRHGGGGRVPDHQLRNLGHRRYFPRFRRLHRCQGRPHRDFNRAVPRALQRAVGLEQQTLGQMIASAALDERARQLRLGISNEAVAKQITADPAFRGFNGEFDRNTFLQRIRDIGYTEQRFVFEQRQTTLRRQIAEAVGAGITPPKVAAEALEHYRGEERSIEYVTLDSSKAGEVRAPTPEQLAAYFEERKVAFRAPEYRKIQLITASQQEIASTIEVSDEDAKSVYQDRLKLYATPERRHIVQVSFANAEDAKRASERIAAGLAFDDFAKEPEIADRLVDLGTVTKADLIDPT